MEKVVIIGGHGIEGKKTLIDAIINADKIEEIHPIDQIHFNSIDNSDRDGLELIKITNSRSSWSRRTIDGKSDNFFKLKDKRPKQSARLWFDNKKHK